MDRGKRKQEILDAALELFSVQGLIGRRIPAAFRKLPMTLFK